MFNSITVPRHWENVVAHVLNDIGIPAGIRHHHNDDSVTFLFPVDKPLTQEEADELLRNIRREVQEMNFMPPPK